MSGWLLALLVVGGALNLLPLVLLLYWKRKDGK